MRYNRTDDEDYTRIRVPTEQGPEAVAKFLLEHAEEPSEKVGGGNLFPQIPLKEPMSEEERETRKKRLEDMISGLSIDE